MQLRWINEDDDPLLNPYRDLRNSNVSRWADGFIAEGKLVVERLLQSSLEVQSILVSEKRLEGFRHKINRDVPVLVVSHERVSSLVGFDFHAGILAHGRRPGFFFCTSPEKRVDRWTQRESCTLVACPHTTLPDNLGSIIRLSAAFAVDGLLVTPQTADPYSRRCIRVSMGNIYNLSVAETKEIQSDFAELKRNGFRIFGCHQSGNSISLAQLNWPPKVVLVFGNEALGIPQDLQNLCDKHIEIPITSGIDSLNVSTAAAIFLYERYRFLRSAE